MKMRLIPVVLSLLLCSFSGASSLEKAKELMQLMEITEQLDSTQEQIGAFAEQMVDSQGLTQEEAEKAKRLARKSMDASFDAMIPWEEMFAEVYASVFTEPELQGIIDFYQSPVGQKFLEKQPELMQATMQQMQGEMAKHMPKIQADIQAAIEEAQASDPE